MAAHARTTALLAVCTASALAVGVFGRASAQGPEAAPPAVSHALRVQQELQRSVQALRPSIVSVTAYARLLAEGTPEPQSDGAPGGWQAPQAQPLYPGFQRIGAASGVVLQAPGSILTCLHPLLDANGEIAPVIDVETVDGRHTLSRFVASEPTLNLALVELEVYSESNPPQIAPAKQARLDSIHQGDWALAVGDPAGAGDFLGIGLFSSRPERQCYQGDLSATLLHASINVHPETFGGALANLQGEVAGILLPLNLRAPRAELGLGRCFALPIDVAAGVHTALSTNPSRQSPWLGFSILEIPALRAHLRQTDPARLRTLDAPLTGVYVDDVHDPSPAYAAGIRPGDYLQVFDGKQVFSVLGFQQQLYLAGIGREVELTLYSKGESRTLKVGVTARPAEIKTR